ncbi:calcium-binding protein [Lyngbya aestuarii]|uniref:calcium-binding protein n=1 Tax=Lyngbya aestuarii TaxID=118322 RepID=UPI00403DE420
MIDPLLRIVGDELLISEAEPDSLLGNDELNKIYPLTDNKTIVCGSQSNIIYGGDGDDIIFADEGENIIYSGEGNDTIYTGSGDDFINPGSGIDNIWLSGGQDTIILQLEGFSIINNFNVSQTKINLGNIDLGSAALIKQGNDTLVGLPHLSILARLIAVDIHTVAANSVDIFGAEVPIFTA